MTVELQVRSRLYLVEVMSAADCYVSFNCDSDNEEYRGDESDPEIRVSIVNIQTI